MIIFELQATLQNALSIHAGIPPNVDLACREQVVFAQVRHVVLCRKPSYYETVIPFNHS